MRELQAVNEQLTGALSHKAAEADSLRELAETVQQQQAATLQARKIMDLSRKVGALTAVMKGLVEAWMAGRFPLTTCVPHPLLHAHHCRCMRLCLETWLMAPNASYIWTGKSNAVDGASDRIHE